MTDKINLSPNPKVKEMEEDFKTERDITVADNYIFSPIFLSIEALFMIRKGGGKWRRD